MRRLPQERADPVELAYMRSAVSPQDALSYETLGQKAGFCRR